MVCEQCRNGEVVVHFTRIQDGAVVSSMDVCVSCARALHSGAGSSGGDSGEPDPSMAMVASPGLMAWIEERGRPDEIAELLALIDRHEREHPDLPLVPAAVSYRQRHRRPAS
jgi:hypothetical protein